MTDDSNAMTDDSNVIELCREPSSLVADAEISRLGQLSLFDYEREREAAAKNLGLRLRVLDELVSRARQTTATEAISPLVPAVETAAWPEPVYGAQLLHEITAAIRQYVVLEKGAAEATALWALHTYCFDAFAITPRLAIISAVMRSGKTTLLDVLSCLVHRPISTANAIPAALYRMIEKLRPTLLIDEADSCFNCTVALTASMRSPPVAIATSNAA
jgi:hypothetical protein